MVDTLNVTIREATGSREARRLRRSGQVPAVLYGHGEDNVIVAIPAGEVQAAIRHGSQLVDITGALSESALIREVQWDAFGNEVLHIDLTRVSAGEEVTVTVRIDLRGEAPGLKQGGVVEQPLHEIEITVPARSIPDHLVANVNSLELHGTITLSELELPEGATAHAEPDQIVAQCVEPVAESEEVATADAGEPEVIGRAAEEEGDNES